MKKSRMRTRDITKVSRAKTPEELFTLLENLVNVLFDLSYLYVFVLNESETEYVLKKNIAMVKDKSKIKRDIKLGLDSHIIMHLLDIKTAFSINDVNEGLGAALIENRHALLLRDELLELKAEVCTPGFLKDKLLTLFIFGGKISKEEFTSEEIELFSLLTRQSARIIHNYNLTKDLLKRDVEKFVDSMRKIINDLEVKDPYTSGHSERVTQFCIIVGRKLKDEVEKIPFGEVSLYYAAELHDVGKINIADEILKKVGPLSDEEYNEIKKHPLESVKIIKLMKKWFGNTIIDAVLSHHENYDGTGYPNGKKGNQTNILARIIRVADSFDAMISDRPYRRAMIHYKVLSELVEGQGKQYDPKVVNAFLEAYREGLFKDIFFSQLLEQDQSKIS